MREIKFRAWHKKIRKMFQVGQITLEKGIWDYEPDDRKNIGVSIPYQPSFILMQYTGLHDKNGKEIYEGDIVKTKYMDKVFIVWVEYSNEYAEFVTKCKEILFNDEPLSDIGRADREVIRKHI